MNFLAVRHLQLVALMLALVSAGCTSEPAAAPPIPLWQMVFDGPTLATQAGQKGALLSAWGKSQNDIWLVGGTQNPADKPTILHWAGTAWQTLPLDVTGTVWWVAGAPDSDDGGKTDAVWFAGTGGLLVRYAASIGKFLKFPMPSDVQLWGVLPFKDTDVWTVGGDATKCGNNQACGVIWHFDGATWSVPPGLPPGWNTTAWFKVFARGPKDVFVCGLSGHILHWDGATWTDDAATNVRLLTGSCNGKLCVAVGGLASGKIVEHDGTQWREVAVGTNLDLLNGVSVRADGTATAVGHQNSADGIWQRDAEGVWTADSGAPAATQPYHAVFTDPTGDLWAVGGDLNMFHSAQLAHRGSAQVSAPVKK